MVGAWEVHMMASAAWEVRSLTGAFLEVRSLAEAFWQVLHKKFEVWEPHMMAVGRLLGNFA